MKYGIDIANFGDFADLRAVGELAAAADGSGWDGFFVWDHIRPEMYAGHNPPTVDPTVMLSVIAGATARLRFGALVTPLPRRRPAKFAREIASLDQLSEGRVVVGVGIGYPPDNEFTSLGRGWRRRDARPEAGMRDLRSSRPSGREKPRPSQVITSL
jgi:alkanesulfonate monooxygenase SsuD/methylene tetrahydromethanopterin reductase-like flavin-dependent oxidoreductase (luciferase family)